MSGVPPSARLFLMTVDCDHARNSPQSLRRKTLDALLETFAKTGLSGRVTWFINERYYDYSLTEHHGPVVQEFVRRGDTAGVHNHIDLLDGRWEYDLIYDHCRRSKEKLAAWLSANGTSLRLRCHRFGCLFQHKTAYAVIRDLGYEIVSDVWPGHEGKNHTQHPAFDNRAMPLGVPPYRHDAENWQDHAAQTGCFLHVPVMHMYLKDFEIGIAKRWIEAAQDSGKPPALTWLIHPYEVLNDERNDVSPAKVDKLRRHLEEAASQLEVRFVNMEQCEKALL